MTKAPPFSSGPAIVLVEPQLGQNIGAVARAMLNFGLGDLRLVAPRPNWLNERTRAMASGADRVLDAARVFETTAAAIADLVQVYATTARPRELLKPVLTPREAAHRLRREHRPEAPSGILFGGERAGLLNQDVILAQNIVTVPLNPAFSSLNLSQAVVLMAYEWFAAGDATPPERFDLDGTRPANRAEMVGLFEHLEAELDASGFFTRIPEKRTAILGNLRNSLQRGQLLEQDVRTLRGVIKALAGRKGETRRRRPEEA